MAAAKGKRYIHTYRQQQYYFNIFPTAKEVFISSAAEQDPLTAAGIDALSRLTSIVWQKQGKQIVLNQLRKSSRSSKDLPGILAILIEENS